MPISYGGGINSLQGIEACLKHGCDKVIINTYILQNPGFLKDAIRCFGSQCIIVSVDYKMDNTGDPILFNHSGYTEHNFSFLEYIGFIDECKAGEIFLTNVDKEGWMNGLDLEIIPRLRDRLDTPILLHGGVGEPHHVYEGFKSGADAVCAGSIFPFSQYSYHDIRKYLIEKKIPIRKSIDPFF